MRQLSSSRRFDLLKSPARIEARRLIPGSPAACPCSDVSGSAGRAKRHRGPARSSLLCMAVAKAPILPQYNRQTVRAEEWLLDQQIFQGVDKAVVAALAQACRSEDISEGQEIQSRGQKLQDLLILREGKALQDNQPDVQGRGAASPVHRILKISHHKSSQATSYDSRGVHNPCRAW
jgi:hypothetical protein